MSEYEISDWEWDYEIGDWVEITPAMRMACADNTGGIYFGNAYPGDLIGG